MAINIQWHTDNKLSADPSIEEKIEWHKKHEKNCDCTPFPKRLKDEAVIRGIPSEKGSFGHMGGFIREFVVTEILSFSKK